jgi:ribosomal protein L20
MNGKFVCYKEIVTHLAQSLKNLWVLRLIDCQQQGLNSRQLIQHLHTLFQNLQLNKQICTDIQIGM